MIFLLRKNQNTYCWGRVPPRACWYTCWFTLQPKNLCQRDLGPNMCVCVCVYWYVKGLAQWPNMYINYSLSLLFLNERLNTNVRNTHNKSPHHVWISITLTHLSQVWLLHKSKNITQTRVAPNAEPTNAAHSKSHPHYQQSHTRHIKRRHIFKWRQNHQLWY